MVLPSVPQEKMQGAVQAEEALAAAAPPPIEPTPTQADEAVVSQIAPVSETGNAPQTGYTVKNPYTLMPARVNMNGVGGQQRKTSVEQNYDVGLLYQVLGQNDPLMRLIANELMGK